MTFSSGSYNGGKNVRLFGDWNDLLKVVDRAFEGTAAPFASGEVRSLLVDIEEFPESYRIAVNVPGVERENIDIELANKALRISVHKKDARKTDDQESDPQVQSVPGKLLRRERYEVSGSRTIALPGEITEEAIDARLENGVLVVSVKKASPPVSRKIAIQ